MGDWLLGKPEDRPDTFVQDVATHTDMWLGIAGLCAALIFTIENDIDQAALFYLSIIGVIIAKIKKPVVVISMFMVGTCVGLALLSGINPFLPMVIIVQLLAATWLAILGLLPGILKRAKQGEGISPILSENLAKRGKAARRERNDKPTPVKTPWVMNPVPLVTIFIVESTLLFLGMYFNGWTQYILGGIGFGILAYALLRAINEKRAIEGLMQKAAAQALERQNQDPEETAPTPDVQPAGHERVHDRAIRPAENFQIMVLTIFDFLLSGLAFVSCMLVPLDQEWSNALASTSFMSAAFWMISLGYTTGYGDPGHLDPDDPDYFEVDERVNMSICELLSEVRAEREMKDLEP